MRTLPLLAAVAGLVAAVAGLAKPEDGTKTSSAGNTPLKIMIAGDSITHGHEGDFTWRYRIWEWLRANNVSVDFVGPYKGTIARDEPLPPQPPLVIGDPAPPLFSKPRIAWGYAEAVPKDFDADHFSTGGYKASLAKEVIRDLVKKYQPDIVLSLIGINDFIWARDTPENLLVSMKTMIDEIRIARPACKFAVGNIIRRNFHDLELESRTAAYNPLLKAAIPTWSTEQSPIYHVDVALAYSCGPGFPHCPAAFDGLHPSTLGSYQIAQVFAQSLIDNFSIGQEPLQIPIALPANRQYNIPINVKAEESSIGVKLTWDHNYGMTSYNVRWQIEGQGWNEQRVITNRFDSITSTAGVVYNYQVCSCHGDRCSRYSEIVTAVSNRDTAPPPTNIRTVSLDGAFLLEWSPPEDSRKWNITQYELSFRNADDITYTAVGSRGLSEKITGFFGLPKGSIWIARMATWTDPEGAGLYEYARPVLIGGGKPEPPQNLKAKHTSRTSALLTWNVTANAAGYQVFWRNLNGKFITDGIIGVQPQKQFQGLVHGRGEYEFCVNAVNGEAESQPTCVIPGTSSVGQYPVDWMRSLSMYSTVWFCALLLVAIFLAMSRRDREEPPAALGGIRLARDRKPKFFKVSSR